MFCKKCGKEIDDSAIVCPDCGCATDNYKQVKSTEQDSSSIGYVFLGFFLPIIGLILYFLWKDSTPLRAKNLAKGAIIGAIVAVVFIIVYSIVIVSIIGGMYNNLN